MNSIFELPPVLTTANGSVDTEAWRNYELRRTQQLQELFDELENRLSMLPQSTKGERGAKGAKGDKGDPGAKGDKGDQGIPGAKGDKGDPGATGATGATGAKGDKGDQGDPGAKGDPGTAATIRIGNVRTSSYSEGAIVSNSGTESDVILNFAIPQGEPGIPGIPGAKGDKGDTGAQGIQGEKGDTGAPGAKGDPGTAATVAVGTVSTLPYGQSATVTNSGTATAAVFDFAIPQGKTPVRGTDYWTEYDQQLIVTAAALSASGQVTPASIGAIADPEFKTAGDLIRWNGSAWVAGKDEQYGVKSVNGKTGEVNTRLFYQNQTIAADYFVLQTSPTYPAFPYVAELTLANVTEAMFPEIAFSPADAMSGNYAPMSETYNGGVRIYAKAKPAGTLTIPMILITI